MDLRQVVLSGLRWSAGMRFLGQVFNWSITLIVIRLLSPGDYGLMELAGVFIAFLAMISELGMGAAVVQRRDLDENDLRAIFGFVLLVSLVICVSLSVAAPFIAAFYNEPQLTLMIWFLSLTFIFSGFVVIPSSLLWREHQYRTISIIDFISGVAGSITTLVLALSGMGVWSLVAGMLSSRLVNTVAYHVVKPFLKLPQVRFRGMKSIFVFSGNVTLARIFWYLWSAASASLIIGKVMGKELLGIYAIGLYLASLPMEKVSGIINTVAFPAFSSVQDDPQLAGAHFLKAVRVLAITTIPLFWGMSSIATEIVGVFLGTKWSAAALPLQIIAISVPLRMVRNLMMPALLGLGYSKVNLINELVAVLLMSVAFYITASWGLTAVSLVWLLIFPLVFVLNLPQTAKAIHIDLYDVCRSMWKPALAGLLMMASVELARRMLGEDVSMIVRMGVLVAVGGGVYLGMTVLFNRSGLNELLSLRR